MFAADIIFLSLLAVAGLAAVVLGRSKGSGVPLLGGALLGVPLAGVLGEGLFGVLRLLAFEVFVVAPALGVAYALLAWRASRTAPRAAQRARPLAALALVVVTVAIGVDAFFVEPRALQVRTVSLTSPRVHEPIRIALVADLQFARFGAHEREAIEQLGRGQPDLVLLAGDYVHEADRDRREAAAAELRAAWRAAAVSPPLGAYAVRGNVDHDDWPAIFQGLGVKALGSETVQAGPAIFVTGRTLGDSFDTRGRVAPVDGFHAVVGHAPDYALGEVNADLAVAGHTHGGQVQLPFFGPLITFSAVPRHWAAGGAFALPSGATLVVSRGIGMERGYAPRLRFLCKPELVFIDVTAAAN